MTQEEKAKAYDEAIEKIKYVMEHGVSPVLNKEDLQDIFPELTESEDEKIRKELLEYVKHCACERDVCKEERDKWIAWLERQGDLTIRFFTDEFELALGRIIAFWNQNHKDGKYDENELMSYIKVRETELVKLFTDNVCKVSLSDCSEEYRKAYYDGYNKCNRDWIKIKDISVDEYNKNAEVLLDGKVKQKSIDKVEPKFKVGDWITDGYLHNKITDVLEDRYIVETKYAKRSAILFDYENRYHLWTIQDAKDGDVLTVNGKPFICYHTDEYKGNYCCIDDNGCFRTNIRFSFEGNCLLPATKEQRNLLFEKMHEAGYMWDAESKQILSLKAEPTREINGFDAELNALLKKYEHLPYDETIECLKYYVGVLVNMRKKAMEEQQ